MNWPMFFNVLLVGVAVFAFSGGLTLFGYWLHGKYGLNTLMLVMTTLALLFLATLIGMGHAH